MSKTQLIDKAIDDLDGVFQPKGDYFCCGRYGLNDIKFSLFYKSDGNYICSREEFEQRKKEREMEKHNWYDYKNMRMLKSPPVGEIVLVNMQSGERKAKVLEVTHNSTKEIFIVRVFNGSVEGVGDLQYKDEARPLDWDKLSKRNHVIEKAQSYMNRNNYYSYRDIIETLYDAGMLILPESSKAEEK